jgi:uridylate kinase
VAGIYDRDPEKDDQAVLLRRLTYFQILERNLRVMDSTAVTMSMEQKIPIIVFKLLEAGNMKKVVLGLEVGTIVENSGHER